MENHQLTHSGMVYLTHNLNLSLFFRATRDVIAPVTH